MHTFNNAVDRGIARPLATAYTHVVPRFARTGVSNFFGNLGDAWTAINQLLQGNGQAGMSDLSRFALNSTLGIAGLFDIASEAGLQKHKEDFGQTLGVWGVESGPYLVLPLLGPSTVRDTAALPVDAWGNPMSAINDIPVRNSLYVLRLVDTRARLLNASDTLDSVALDRYSLTRDVYLNLRRGKSGDDGRIEALLMPGDAGYDELPDR